MSTCFLSSTLPLWQRVPGLLFAIVQDNSFLWLNILTVTAFYWFILFSYPFYSLSGEILDTAHGTHSKGQPLEHALSSTWHSFAFPYTKLFMGKTMSEQVRNGDSDKDKAKDGHNENETSDKRQRRRRQRQRFHLASPYR